MDMIKKQFDFEIKQLGEEKDRVLRFVGSTEDVDRDGDIIEVSGWKTDNYMKNPVVLWSHNSYSMPPIAKTIKVQKDTVSRKLMFDIKFPTLDELSTDVDNPAEHAKFVDMIYNMCKNGYLNATSVGFRGVKFKTRDDADVLEKPEWQRGRRYLEQELNEISIVNIPANQNALAEARGKGLIDDISIKSFFNAENEVKTVEGEEKTGARLSKETIESMTAIMGKMNSALDTYGKAHKEALKACKGCMDEWKVALGVSDGVSVPANPDTSDGVEEPKAMDELLQLVKSMSEEIKTLKAQQPTKDATKDEIDLDAIKFTPKAAKDTADNELNIEPEQLKAMFEEVVNKKLNAALGRID